MNKKQTIQLIVIASSAAAMTFLAYKAWKLHKERKEELVEIEWDDKFDEPIEQETTDVIPGVVSTYPIVEYLDEGEVEDLDGYEGAYTSLEALEEAGEDDEEIYTDGSEEGVEELRFHKDSEEALHQFKEMNLAEFEPTSQTTIVLWQLFNVEYKPTTPEDGHIKETLISERKAFFGLESVHNDFISIAEFLLYFARTLDFDLDGGVYMWAEWLVKNLGITPGIGAITLENIIDSLMSHNFQSQYGFGLFAFSNERYKDMLTSTNNSTVRYPTFLAQYHVFIKFELPGGVSVNG